MGEKKRSTRPREKAEIEPNVGDIALSGVDVSDEYRVSLRATENLELRIVKLERIYFKNCFWKIILYLFLYFTQYT